MKYRIAQVNNKKLVKIIRDYKHFSFAKKKFNKLKEENQNILFPKKFVNTKAIKAIKYEILLLEKVTSEEKTSRMVINDSGRVVEETVIGDWKIISKFSYFFEESFYVYGLKKRLEAVELLENVFGTRLGDVYQCVMVLNKIVLHNDTDIEVILCKNLQDTKRLYDFIVKFFYTRNIHSIMFWGEAKRKDRRELYDRIQKHTGLVRKELYRTSTRS